MAFEDWLVDMRQTGQVPFGTAYEMFARKAYDAAIAEEREACAKIAEEMADATAHKIKDAIRKREHYEK